MLRAHSADTEETMGLDFPDTSEDIRQEQAATEVQAAFRGYLVVFFCGYTVFLSIPCQENYRDIHCSLAHKCELMTNAVLWILKRGLWEDVRRTSINVGIYFWISQNVVRKITTKNWVPTATILKQASSEGYLSSAITDIYIIWLPVGNVIIKLCIKSCCSYCFCVDHKFATDFLACPYSSYAISPC